jgi:hypothetical protein
MILISNFDGSVHRFLGHWVQTKYFIYNIKRLRYGNGVYVKGLPKPFFTAVNSVTVLRYGYITVMLRKRCICERAFSHPDSWCHPDTCNETSTQGQYMIYISITYILSISLNVLQCITMHHVFFCFFVIFFIS